MRPRQPAYSGPTGDYRQDATDNLLWIGANPDA
jgi:hypothetical protein